MADEYRRRDQVGNSDNRTTRRGFLGASGSAAALLLAPKTASADTKKPLDYPFTLGIASGDPLPDSVVLWTRLAPEPLQPLGGMPYQQYPVRWEVAKDERFKRVVRRGVVRADPAYVHSVHVDVRGLDAGRVYYYRFHAYRHTSPVGRTKTAPAAGTHVGQLSFAVASCQSWPDGYYTAYQHMAREDLDFVVHLGDYIYEYAINSSGGHRGTPVPHQFRTPANTLDRYRIQYGLYKSDPDLQAAHAAFPFVATPDDHEVANNWTDEDLDNVPPDEFLVRRANAFRAYWEHMPFRPNRRPRGPDMALYRRLSYGDLVQLYVLDGRQYRSDQACDRPRAAGCRERLDPSRTVLGFPQESWLYKGLANSNATWNVLANQVPIAQFALTRKDPKLLFMDAWDGYKPARDRLFNALTEHDVANPVVISGDRHHHHACDLKADFDDADSPTLGVEFVATSVTSGQDGQELDSYCKKVLDAGNPHVKLSNAQRGYVRMTVTPDQCRGDHLTLPFVTDPDAPISTHASFVSEAGNLGLQPAST